MSALDGVNQNVIALAALVISLVALFTTVVQVLQQYFSSAEGYRRCADSVMGKWADETHRRIRWNEFRFEVVFETPVIFLAPPTNKRGPLDKPIHYIDGTTDSYQSTKVLEPAEQKEQDKVAGQRVRTADDEKASWVTLLSCLQTQERASREWDYETRMKTPNGLKFEPPTYGVAVGLQAKKRSWDFVPASITRPYATTAICHLVEMTAMLGMYWKTFDQTNWNLRAEGNGFIVTSTMVHGLGVMIGFAITGRSSFTENRIIPSEDVVKELSFGTVPNIFDDNTYLENDSESQGILLQFGSPDDVASTLESLGCTHDVLKRYKKDHKHIFSVSFELIGMLAKVFRQRGSNFRMIPNPTQDPWPKKVGTRNAWKITELMRIFQAKLIKLSEEEGFNETNHDKHPIAVIIAEWKNIKEFNFTDETTLGIEAREAIHDALDERTVFLKTYTKQKEVLDVLKSHLDQVTRALEASNSPLNSILSAHKEEPLLDNYFRVIRKAVCEHDSFTKSEIEQRNIIWLTLIYRMLLWFLLHDWNKDDRCGVPSDLKGSRMPVFIG